MTRMWVWPMALAGLGNASLPSPWAAPQLLALSGRQSSGTSDPVLLSPSLQKVRSSIPAPGQSPCLPRLYYSQVSPCIK